MNIVKSLLSRSLTLVIGLVCGLVVSRLILTAGGVENFALYTLIVSLPALVPFADLGTGAVLVNSLSSSTNPATEGAIVKQVRSVLRIMMTTSLVIVGVDIALLLSGAWTYILASAAYTPAAPVVAFCCVLIFAVSLPLGIWSRILLGLHKNHLVVIIQGLQPIITMVLIALAIFSGRVELAWLALLAFLSMTGVAIVGVIVADKQLQGMLSVTMRTSTRPKSFPGARVMNVGLPMLAQTITPPIATQLVRLVTAQSVSVAALAEYGLLLQVFMPLAGLVSTVGLSLWPYYNRVRSQGGRTVSPFRLSVLFGGAAVIAVALLCAIGPQVFVIISASTVDVDRWVIVAFGAQLVTQALLYPMGMSMMDEKGIRFQVLPALSMAVSTVALTAFMAPHIGIVAGPLAASVSTLICQVIPFIVYVIDVRGHQAND